MARQDRNPANFLTATSGVITIEFVITLPIILAALFLVYELGRALLAYETVSQDLRNASRYLSRVESADVTNPSDPAVQAAINIAMTGSAGTTAPGACPASYPPASSSPCHYPWTSGSTITVTSTPFTSPPYNANGNAFTLTASVPMNVSLLSFMGGPAAITIYMSDTAQYIGD
jgi:Flp pilus assembly protein TadG